MQPHRFAVDATRCSYIYYHGHTRAKPQQSKGSHITLHHPPLYVLGVEHCLRTTPLDGLELLSTLPSCALRWAQLHHANLAFKTVSGTINDPSHIWRYCHNAPSASSSVSYPWLKTSFLLLCPNHMVTNRYILSPLRAQSAGRSCDLQGQAPPFSFIARL